MRPPHAWSTRTRLTVGAAVVIAVTVGVASAGVVIALRHSLLGAVDTAARDDARDIAAAYARNPSAVIQPPTPDAAIQVLDPTGQVVAASTRVPGRPLVATGAPGIVATGRLPIRGSADSYHVAVLRRPGESFTVVVALPSDDVSDAVSELEQVLLVAGPLLFAALVALAALVVGRALAPVEQMGRRQRAFVADAAHELRTPLAGVLAQLELAEETTDRADVARVREELARLARLVDSLLALARADEGMSGIADVDLDEVVHAAVTRARPRSVVTITARDVRPARVRGDATLLGRLVDNLLDNAARHARSVVTVGLDVDGRDARLVVEDDGPGVPVTEREHVFDRFTRLDAGRGREDGGAGLGLAIVRAVATAHRGSVTVEGNDPGARFVVRLPADTG